MDARQSSILKAIVHSYILDAEPIGSRTLAKKYKLGLSPASIRNSMLELEENDFIEKTHISSGRVPTDKGYRFYIDSLMELERLSEEEEIRIGEIREAYRKKREKIRNLLKTATKTLSEMTNCAGLVTAPTSGTGAGERFSRIYLMAIDEHRFLAVLSTPGGLVINQLIEANSVPSQRSLDMIGHRLSSQPHGFILDEVLSLVKMVDEKEQKKLNDLVIQLKSVIAQEKDPQESLLVEGHLNLLDHPEFQGAEQVKLLLKVLENRGILMELLDDRLSIEDVRVLVGVETHCDDLKNLSIVSGSYQGGDMRGVLGVIGPRRMEYPRIMALVRRLADQIGDMIVGDDKNQ